MYVSADMYVYFTYGNHWMLNAITERGFSVAVLIRAIQLIEGIDILERRNGGDTPGPGNHQAGESRKAKIMSN